MSCARFVLAGTTAAIVGLALTSQDAAAAPVYLNGSNITVALGPSMGPGNPFANRGLAESLASVIDAPSATATEFHTQSTHVWVSGGPLELAFDFGSEYDLSTLHFWNYHSEGFDVDGIAFTFFNAANALVGTLNAVPRLGNVSGTDGAPITPEDYALTFPSNVRYVTAMLTGTNSQVDFNNIGFTATLSDPPPTPTPEPASLGLIAVGLAAAGWRKRRGRLTAGR